MSTSIHFYRILMPDYPSTMILPLGLSASLPSKNTVVTLRNLTTGRSWEVDLISEGGRHYFGGERWPEFTVANNLDFGFILIFCFEEGEFTFRAYNLRGFEINVASSENVNANANQEAEVLDSLKKMDVGGTSGVAKDDDLDSLSWDWDDDEDDENADHEENKKEERKTLDPREEVAESSRRRQEKVKNTWFYTKITSRHLNGDNAYKFYVPARFSNAVGLSTYDKKEVRIIDPLGQRCIIGCRYRVQFCRGHRYRQIFFAKDWRKLLVENDVKVGETYKFELVTRIGEDGLITVRMTKMKW